DHMARLIPYTTLFRSDGPAWWISQIQAHLEQRAAAVPVLVCLDDLHWANPATLVALRTLPRDLKRHPIAWILARSNTQHQDAERSEEHTSELQSRFDL